jgi:hypothetical protein
MDQTTRLHPVARTGGRDTQPDAGIAHQIDLIDW